jgi:choline dehydrogenase-like flavoprotein
MPIAQGRGFGSKVGFNAAHNAAVTLGAGFTTVRDVGAAGNPEIIFALRAAIAERKVAGPRILCVGAVLSPTGGHGQTYAIATTFAVAFNQHREFATGWTNVAARCAARSAMARTRSSSWQPAACSPTSNRRDDIYPDVASIGSMPTIHLMGGTIMGTEAGNSVVNSYGQTHEIPNLYVAGLGIFATSGASNPTYTIFALSLRGAEQLAASWGTVTD